MPDIVPAKLSLIARLEAALDRDLVKMPPTERLPELQRVKVKFIGLSEEFAARIDSGQAPKYGESAWDYTLALAAIEERIARERTAGVPPHAQDGWAPEDCR